MTRSIIARFLILVVSIAVLDLSARAADPTLNKIGPATVAVGDPDFTLRVSGEDFDRASVVLLDGVAVPTTFVAKNRLYARIPVSASAAAGSHAVAVRGASGTTTAAKPLTVVAKSPGITITRVNRETLQVLTQNINIEFRVSGTGVNANSRVLVFGEAMDTTVREKGVLSVIVPFNLLMDAAFVPFQVKNGSDISNMLTVPVYGRVASIDTLDPGLVHVGDEKFTLKINGNGFDPDAKVVIDGVELTPTEITSQQIKVEVPASLVTDEAQLPVYVKTSTGLSNAGILRVAPDTAPYAFSLSPISVQAGSTKTKISIVGANFKENSEVFLNGTKVQSSFVTAGRLTFKLTEAQAASPGTFTVSVKNADGMTSNTVSIDVVDATLVSTLAGKELDGFVDGTVDVAKFRYPSRAAVGPDGMIYVADQSNHAVRRVDPISGSVVTLVGDGQPGYVDTGDSTAQNFSVPRFNNPLGIAVGGDGVIYVADYGNNVIRRVRASGSGFVVDTVAGANERIEDKETRDATNSTRKGLQGYLDGAGATARFRGVDGMSMGTGGRLFVADALNVNIRVIDTTNGSFSVDTVAGINVAGFVDGDITTARFILPVDIAISPDQSTLVVADLGNFRIRQVDLVTGAVSTLAGSGAPGTSSGTTLFASFVNPIGVSYAGDGNVYVTDHGSNTIRRVTPDGTTTTVAGGSTKTKFRDGIGPIARFKDPRGVVYVPSLGELLIIDQGHSRLRKIEP
jgi:sugar lactone lactonase YvrE